MLQTAKPISKNNNTFLRLNCIDKEISGMQKIAEDSAYNPINLPPSTSLISKSAIICCNTPEGKSSDKIPTKVTDDINIISIHGNISVVLFWCIIQLMVYIMRLQS